MALETNGHVLLLFLLVVMSYFFQEVNKQQPSPYMDEIFHIPQAQNYCSGHFNHWNKKITTLPGLYLSSQLFLKIYTIFSDKGIDSICDTKNLRLTNVIFIMGCATILRGILRILYKTENNEKEEKVSSMMSHIPILNIFNFDKNKQLQYMLNNDWISFVLFFRTTRKQLKMIKIIKEKFCLPLSC